MRKPHPRLDGMNAIACLLGVSVGAFLLASAVFAQAPDKIVTKADVEKVKAAKFRDGWNPMPTQVMFQQEGGDLQVSVEVEPRDAGTTVRGWEATMKKFQPNSKVDTVPGLGKDAIYYTTRADLGAVSADYDTPRVQLRVSVSGA